MSVTVPTQAEFSALVARVANLETAGGAVASRLATLEAAVKGLPPVIPPILPPPTGVTYYQTNFADGTLGPLTFSSYGGTGTWAKSADYHEPDSPWSLKCTIPGTVDDSAELVAQFGQGMLQPADPTLDQDLFQQVRFVLAPGALAAIGGVLPVTANKTSQFKIHKSTYGPVGSNTNGWVMCSVGPWDHVGFAAIPELYVGGAGAPWPGPVLEGQVYDVVYRYHRYTAANVGTMAVWVNGVKVLDSAKSVWWGDKKGSTAGLRLRDGAEYLQGALGPLSVYVLSTRATSFPIGAGVASV